MVDMIVFVGVGLLFVALAIPLIRRRVPPNSLYGLRIEATLSDPAIWYEANARSGWHLLVVGLVVTAVSALVWLLPGLSDGERDALRLGVMVTGVFATAARGYATAERLSQERNRDRER